LEGRPEKSPPPKAAPRAPREKQAPTRRSSRVAMAEQTAAEEAGPSKASNNSSEDDGLFEQAAPSCTLTSPALTSGQHMLLPEEHIQHADAAAIVAVLTNRPFDLSLESSQDGKLLWSVATVLYDQGMRAAYFTPANIGKFRDSLTASNLQRWGVKQELSIAAIVQGVGALAPPPKRHGSSHVFATRAPPKVRFCKGVAYLPTFRAHA
jgi:hypothetical protein